VVELAAIVGSDAEARVRTSAWGESGIKWLMIALCCSMCVIFLAVFQTSFTYGELFNDPADVVGFHPFIGMISMFGLFGWAAAAGVSFLTYAVIRQDGSVQLRRFFLCAGIFTLFLMMDDAFMLHELVLPIGLGIRERYIKMAYLAAAAIFGAVFVRQLLGHGPVILVAAGLFFAGSFFFDSPVVLSAFGFFESSFVLYVVEDGFKFTGILLWLTWLFRAGLQTVRSRSDRAGSGQVNSD
jgi:uncharacterized membrane protein